MKRSVWNSGLAVFVTVGLVFTGAFVANATEDIGEVEETPIVEELLVEQPANDDPPPEETPEEIVEEDTAPPEEDRKVWVCKVVSSDNAPGGYVLKEGINPIHVSVNALDDDTNPVPGSPFSDAQPSFVVAEDNLQLCLDGLPLGDATASVSTLPATCELSEQLVYSGTNASFSGTADGTYGPANYSVTATADSGYTFAGGLTETFNGSLAGALDPSHPSCGPPPFTDVTFFSFGDCVEQVNGGFSGGYVSENSEESTESVTMRMTVTNTETDEVVYDASIEVAPGSDEELFKSLTEDSGVFEYALYIDGEKVDSFTANSDCWPNDEGELTVDVIDICLDSGGAKVTVSAENSTDETMTVRVGVEEDESFLLEFEVPAGEKVVRTFSLANGLGGGTATVLAGDAEAPVSPAGVTVGTDCPPPGDVLASTGGDESVAPVVGGVGAALAGIGVLFWFLSRRFSLV